MFRSDMPSLAKDSREELARTPWEGNPALMTLLSAIITDAAEEGLAARLVVHYRDDQPHVLISAGHCSTPWRGVATVVLARGEVHRRPGVIGAPIHGALGLRGALLLHTRHDKSLPGGAAIARAHAARIEQALEAAALQQETALGAVDALLHMLAAHDPETARHARKVRDLARVLGERLGLPLHALLELEWAALLHDVGKIAVPVSVLRKGEPLTESEWALIRQHPSIGEGIVRAIPGLQAVSIAVRHHHERWDGGGYPDRLSGEATPLPARVVALVDAYETMRSGRPYRGPIERDQALRELQRSAGTQFDPALLCLLHALAERDIAL